MKIWKHHKIDRSRFYANPWWWLVKVMMEGGGDNVDEYIKELETSMYSKCYNE